MDEKYHTHDSFQMMLLHPIATKTPKGVVFENYLSRIQPQHFIFCLHDIRIDACIAREGWMGTQSEFVENEDDEGGDNA